jgi:glutathione synthase
MKIGFLVNDLATEYPRYTTTVLANGARKRGHEVFYLTVEDFTYRADGKLWVRGRSPKKPKGLRTYREYLEALQENARCDVFEVSELDVLMLRNDPAADIKERPWAQSVGTAFGREAVRSGVIVLNDPDGLALASNKFYFQLFPERVRPRTLITRDPQEIKRFAADNGGRVVLKPLQGSGGESVFLVREDEEANLNQMIEAVRRSGYVVAQEYLPAASEGDVRLFLMNGEPLKVKGKIAALRRVNAEGDLRSNMHAGGRAEAAEIGDTELEIAEQVRPRLKRDGMFLVGLDIAGDKLLEINVFSPGGLHSAQRLAKADFTGAILDALERKVADAAADPGAVPNAQLAVL